MLSKILLYVLADRYDVPELRKEIVDWEYHNLVGSFIYGLPWNAKYIQALRNLPFTSPMIRFMIDLHVDRHSMNTDRDACGTDTLLRQKFSPEFLVAVIDGYAALKGTEAKKGVKQLCAYLKNTHTPFLFYKNTAVQYLVALRIFICFHYNFIKCFPYSLIAGFLDRSKSD